MKDQVFGSLKELNHHVIHCRRCPRLVQFRESVPPKKIFEADEYWRKPVPGFGDPKGWLLITGLAPAAHGGNRTGRLFTGDATSKFLMHALFKAGFSNQQTSTSFDDGLKLNGCYMTAVVKCAPPMDKPTVQECQNCSVYYQNELKLLKNLTHVLLLGKVAFDSFKRAMKPFEASLSSMTFQHGQRYALKNLPLVAFASYHPSPQNTNTGKLKQDDFVEIFLKVKKEHHDQNP